MGPVLFTLYVSRLSNIISQHLPAVHGYADDTQIYLSFRPCSIHSEINAVSVIEKCMMFALGLLEIVLMVNDAKTDFLIIGTRQQLEKTPFHGLQVTTQPNSMLHYRSFIRETSC